MGPRQWTYGQRSRSNPRSHSGRLHRPHVEDVYFKPRIDDAEGRSLARPPTPGNAWPRWSALCSGSRRCHSRTPDTTSSPRPTGRPSRSLADRALFEAWTRLSGRRCPVAAVCTDRGNADRQFWAVGSEAPHAVEVSDRCARDVESLDDDPPAIRYTTTELPLWSSPPIVIVTSTCATTRSSPTAQTSVSRLLKVPLVTSSSILGKSRRSSSLSLKCLTRSGTGD